MIQLTKTIKAIDRTLRFGGPKTFKCPRGVLSLALLYVASVTSVTFVAYLTYVTSVAK